MIDYGRVVYDAMRATHRPVACVLNRKVKSGHDATAGAPITSPETYYFDGCMFAVTGTLFDQDLVESGDFIILVSQYDIETTPANGDRIAAVGTPADLYSVVAVKQFYGSGMTPHAYALLVRK